MKAGSPSASESKWYEKIVGSAKKGSAHAVRALAVAKRYPPAMRTVSVALPVALSLASCMEPPPSQWAHGGAPLVIREARWRNGEGTDIELRPDGKVLVEGSVLFVLDRAGRVYDPQNEPVAMLLPDGNIAGTGDRHFGRIGITNASPPGGGYAWLAVLPDGRVVHFDPDGQRSTDGVWRGCQGPQFRTCTLVTQLVTLHRIAAASHGAVSVGVGVGVGFWP